MSERFQRPCLLSFFVEHKLGKDIFLICRVPDQKIEGAESKVFAENGRHFIYVGKDNFCKCAECQNP